MKEPSAISPTGSEHLASDLKMRVLSAAVIAPIAILSIAIGGLAFELLILVCYLAMVYEWASINGLNPKSHLESLKKFLLASAKQLPSKALPKKTKKFLFASLWTCFPPLALIIMRYVYILGETWECVVLGGLFLILKILPRDDTVNSVNFSGKARLFDLGFLYISIPMYFWIIYSILSDHNICRIYVFWVFSIVWSCDIFAYFGGRLIGGAKFAPSISPNKTWSGVITGSVAAIVVSYFYLSYFQQASPALVISSAFMVAASVLGDLLESKVKRLLNVKDTGSIIPGHGGVCDRLDSFLMVSYVFIAVWWLFL